MMMLGFGRGQTFTDRDWRFPFRQPREKVFALELWLRFAALWFAVAVIGFAVSFYLLPYGLVVCLCAALTHRGDLPRRIEMAAVTTSRSSFPPKLSADPGMAR
jgi:fatty acid desaturase